MKILALGDIHGVDYWKQAIEKEKPDLTIFIGDYNDSRDIPRDKQYRNL